MFNKNITTVLENNYFESRFIEGEIRGCNCKECKVIKALEWELDLLENEEIEDFQIYDLEEYHNLYENDYFNIFSDCIDCINDNSHRFYMFYCDYHNEYELSKEEPVEVENDTICYEARGDIWERCFECGENYYIDNLIYYNENGEYYCGDCTPCSSQFIFDYHNWNGEYQEIGISKEGIYLGFEIEAVHDNYNLNEAIEQFNDICNFKDFDWQYYFHIEQDGSLNNGLEFISQPLSFNVAYEIIPKITSCLKLAGFYIDNSCGGHVHITRNALSMNKSVDILQFIENNKDFILDYSRRNKDNFNRWSPFYNEDLKALEEIANELTYRERYHCINFNNYNTIEFRFFNGTLSHNHILANIELIKALLFYDINKTHSKYRIREIVNNNKEDFKYLDIFLSHYLDNPF